MPSPQGPLLPRRRLGAELRRLRGDRTLDEVAAETMISTSKLSRLENGQGVPQPRDIRDLISFYDADRLTADRLRRWMNEGRRQAWWKEYSDVMSDSADVTLDYESGASVIRTYAPMVLPGLVQTEQYAGRLLALIMPDRTPEQIGKLVQVRLRRQQILLTDSAEATRLLAVIDEAAIRRAQSLDGPDEGRAQLEHLLEISQRPNVSIRIMPLEVGLHPGVLGMFEVFQFSDDIDRDVVHLEARAVDRYLEEQASVLDHLRLFDALSHRALDNAGSRDLLSRLLTASHRQQEQK
jgi:transcriptional regulator with XRE-family HTH domain